MLPVQLSVLKAIAISTLALQLIQPLSPPESSTTAHLTLPDGPQAVANVSLLSKSSSAIPAQWDGTIALPFPERNISLSSPTSNDAPRLLNDTYLSTFNISKGSRSRLGPSSTRDLPPLPSGWSIGCNRGLGTDMISSSCLDAWLLIPPIEEILTFGPRNTANKYDVSLPKRYLSCTL